MEDNEILNEDITNQSNDSDNVVDNVVDDVAEDVTEDAAEVLNNAWQEKFTALTTKYQNAIAERDNIIRQLINNDKIDNTDVTDSIVEKINRQRKFKKW